MKKPLNWILGGTAAFVAGALGLQAQSEVVETSTDDEGEVTTVIQQIDSEGPVAVDRITTSIGDLACTPDDARLIVEGLHSGTTITLNANGNGGSVTIQPTVQLGYGEEYIALAVAADELREAGITSCATPEQWRAVLLGGSFSVSGTTRVSGPTEFPGVLVLRSRGEHWGRIAQSTHVQLHQVVSRAHSSFNRNKARDENERSEPTRETDRSRTYNENSRPSTSGSMERSRSDTDTDRTRQGTEMNRPETSRPTMEPGQSDRNMHPTDVTTMPGGKESDKRNQKNKEEKKDSSHRDEDSNSPRPNQ